MMIKAEPQAALKERRRAASDVCRSAPGRPILKTRDPYSLGSDLGQVS